MSTIGTLLEALGQVAARHDQPLRDTWGETVVRWSVDGFVPEDVADAVAGGLDVQVAFEGQPRRVPYDETPPGDDDIAAATALVTVASERTDVEAATTRREMVEVVAERVVEVEVGIRRRAWARTEQVLQATVQARPAQVLADAAVARRLGCGTDEISLSEAADALEGRRRAGAGEPNPLRDAAAAVVDAMGWLRVATDRRRHGDSLLVALRRDAEPDIPVTLDGAVVGGRRLADWLEATGDPNRGEAMRFVLTQVTTAITGDQRSLPPAAGVRELAERYRIALSQENAAAVAAAAAASHETAIGALSDARQTVDDEVNGALKGAGTVIGALVAVAALIVRNTTVFPDGAIWVVVVVLVTVEIGLLIGQWSRIDDGLDALRRRRERIAEDPLLPEDDRSRALASTDLAGVQRRANVARTASVLLTLLTSGAVVYVGAAVANIN